VSISPSGQDPDCLFVCGDQGGGISSAAGMVMVCRDNIGFSTSRRVLYLPKTEMTRLCCGWTGRLYLTREGNRCNSCVSDGHPAAACPSRAWSVPCAGRRGSGRVSEPLLGHKQGIATVLVSWTGNWSGVIELWACRGSVSLRVNCLFNLKRLWVCGCWRPQTRPWRAWLGAEVQG